MKSSAFAYRVVRDQVAVGKGIEASEADKIKAPLLLHFAGIDPRINGGWSGYEAALKAASVRYQAFVYEGANHGFNNDTTPRFDAQAAGLAWQRTTAFLREQLA